MEYYDYFEEMKKDILQYIKDNGIDLGEASRDALDEELWVEDCITGNGGLYYDSETNCMKYLAGNNGLLFEAAEELCVELRTLLLRRDDINRYCDSIIRCYLLYSVVDDIFNEYEEAHRD